MKQLNKWKMAAMMILCGIGLASVFTSCKDDKAAKSQLLEVYDV